MSWLSLFGKKSNVQSLKVCPLDMFVSCRVKYSIYKAIAIMAKIRYDCCMSEFVSQRVCYERFYCIQLMSCNKYLLLTFSTCIKVFCNYFFCCRLVTEEDKTVLYFSTQNSRVYHGREPMGIDISANVCLVV